MTPAAIRLDGVDVRFGSARGLESIDLQLGCGHVIASHGQHA